MVDKKKNVLLIEDDPKVAKELQKVLNSDADFAMECVDQKAGLKRIGKGGLDVILMDLPVKDGLDAFLKVKAEARVPVLVLSGADQEKTAVEAVKHGASDYILKSDIDDRALYQSIRNAIELKKVQENLEEVQKQLDSANAKLDALANIDNLTELLNRKGLEASLQNEFSRAQRGGWQLVAMLVDCDDFDRVNQTLGHAVGDVVLKEISTRLRETLRPTDHIARLGGDEFLVLLPDTRFAEGMLVAEKVRLAVAENPLRLASETIRVTASLGVMALPYEFCSIEEMISLARLAVRESKMLGKNRVSSGEKHKSLGADREVLTELTERLRRGDCFRAVSMPIFKLDDESIVGHEILSRGPAGAFEMPDDLFRVSVEYNLLTIVDLRCLKTCLIHTVDPKFDRKARFHVNLFPSTIIDTPIERLMTLFPDNGKTASYCVEISEQQFIGDPVYLRNHVQALKDQGVKVAIDDVGFGRSSLESLIILEPDIVKIDRKYVSGISEDQVKARNLERLVRVVNALGSELVAEGIENKDELAILVDMGVVYGQGWYWGKPA
ncbi:MAG TPA: diguanylate cyclase [Candidatus Melainabacteria bacterium]|jgi:diguanylate cyclase (GGDEF)-like protein|nr:diguanylate cyclase [Candidatus Melainabacteria bacterium]HIN65520.1 diguanylate cyclase [Candidatus Obscuribacterales bacterium]